MSLLLNCKTIKPVDQPAPIAIDEPQGELVAISWSTSNISGGQVRVFRVITDALDIAVMSKQLNHEINPEKEMILVAAMGQRNTGGYRVSIDSVRELPDRLTAYVTEKSPGRDDMVTMAITSPIAYAIIARSDKMVYFNVNNQLILPEPKQICGTFSQVKEPTTMVARSEAEARDIFGKSGPLIATPNTELMAVDMPKIDFATEMVVAVFSGQVRAGTSLRIANIITNEDGVQVFYVITPPDPQAIGVDVMISPYAIA